MKTIWENDFGEQFDTMEEARDAMYDNMELTDYIEGLADKIDIRSLLEWCWFHTDNKFIEDFEDKIYEVEDDFFNENYHEVEVEDEED